MSYITGYSAQRLETTIVLGTVIRILTDYCFTSGEEGLSRRRTMDHSHSGVPGQGEGGGLGVPHQGKSVRIILLT